MRIAAKEINFAHMPANHVRKIKAVVCDSETIIYNFFFTDGSVVSAILSKGNDYLVIIPD